MPPISFNCPHCHETIKAAESMAGEDKRCPVCDRQFRVPVPPPTVTAKPIPQPEPVRPSTAPKRLELQSPVSNGPFYVADMMRPVLLLFFFPSFLAALFGCIMIVIAMGNDGDESGMLLFAFAAIKVAFWSAMGLILIDIERTTRKPVAVPKDEFPDASKTQLWK